jgi:hypothetical protein
MMKMSRFSALRALLLICLLAANAGAAHVILNEYNAVDSDEFLGGGTAMADESGGRAYDTYFGRVLGNGGDWFELVVITDHLDMRNWKIDIYEAGMLDETLEFTNHPIWSDLRSGTIITIAEDVPSDISYNPAAGDWWINVQANDGAEGLYIEPSSFPVGADNWQIVIRNAAGTPVFGPAGEGISPASGISGTEVFRLEAVPSAAVDPNSPDYDDGKDLSTFGAPNQWGIQDFTALRSVVAQPSTLTLTRPLAGENLAAGKLYNITWTHTGAVDTVAIEFSIERGEKWTPVYPANVGNTGAYQWLVPMVESNTCLIRITNVANTFVYDISELFSITRCDLPGDVTGDCKVDLYDLTVLAASWLNQE